MTVLSDFSDDEWGVVMAGLVAPGMGAVILDQGFVATLKELKAIAETLLGAAEHYPDVELVASIGAQSTRVELVASIGSQSTRVKQVLIDPDLSLDKQLESTLDMIREALHLIDARATPHEARAYRRLCLEVALASARASGNGVFGIGAKVSPQEKAYIRRVEALLALD